MDVGSYIQFESLAVRLVSRFSSFIAVCVYTPSSQVRTSAIFDELSDLLDHLVALDIKYVLCGDFNCPGIISDPSLDDRLTHMFTGYGLTQHVNEPTQRMATCSTSF